MLSQSICHNILSQKVFDVQFKTCVKLTYTGISLFMNLKPQTSHFPARSGLNALIFINSNTSCVCKKIYQVAVADYESFVKSMA